MGRPEPQTLVSCIYDLEKRERIGRRPIEFYYEHAELVLGLEQPLVVYADPELAPWLWARRRAQGLEALTRIVERPLETARLFPFVGMIEGFRTFANSDPLKGTGLHQLVQWSKFDLLDETMLEDPFGTDHFAWIDLGIGHVAAPPVTFPRPTRRVALLQMCAVAPQEARDRMEFVGWERGRIAAGFLRGHRETMEALVEAFKIQLDAALALEFRPNEQMLLSYLTVVRPELFEFYYGDYASILCNWDFVRRDIGTVLLNLRHCRSTGLWARAVDVCDRTFAAEATGTLRLTDDQRAVLLDEHAVTAWHAGHEDEAAASLRALLAAPAGAPYVAAHGDRLRSNLALMTAPPTGSARRHVEGPAAIAPVVSVVVPVHNGEATLERAVRSALAQTRGDLEIILVDDGSRDGSLAIAKALAEEDSRVRVVTRSTASGRPACPRDEGVAAARGDLIALLDQDDYWLSHKLAAQLPRFADDEVAVVYSDAYVVEEPDTPGASPRLVRSHVTAAGGRLPEGDLSAHLLREDCIPCLTAVVRREWLERVGRFDRHGLVGVDDYYLWLRIALSGGRFAAVQRALAVHTRRADSLGTTRAEACTASLGRMWEAVQEEFSDHPALRRVPG